MKLYHLIVVILLVLISCAKQEKIVTNFSQIQANNDDLQTLLAFDDLYNGKRKEAFEKFYSLYKSTNTLFYVKEAFKLTFFLKNDSMYELAQIVREKMQDDIEAMHLLIGYEVSKNNTESAIKIAKELIKKDKTASINYHILGTIYFLKNNKIEALNMFRQAYKLDESEVNLAKLVETLDGSFNKTQEAINITKDWINKNSDTRQSYLMLLSLYAKNADYDNMVKTYITLYEKFGEEVFLNDALSLLLYKNNLQGTKKLLETYNINDMLLIEIYAKLKLYNKAYNLSAKLYEKEKKPEFQARMAIYKYEKNPKNLSKFELDQIVRLFEESTSKLEDGIYYNYYGYLLIDHDLDIKKGLELVKKAHELMPDANFIIDSVAWGYYKNGECKLARQWLDKVLQDKEFLNSSEVKEHISAINKCLSEQK